MNLPNKITLFRVALIPIMIALMMIKTLPTDLAVTAVFIVASISDFLDGYLARKRNQVTDFGKLMDPIADKLLVLSAMIMLVERGRMAGFMLVVFLARELLISGFRLVASGRGEVVSASIWGKIKTVMQMFAIVAMMLEGLLPSVFSTISDLLMWAALLLALASLVEYLSANRSIVHDIAKGGIGG